MRIHYLQSPKPFQSYKINGLDWTQPKCIFFFHFIFLIIVNGKKKMARFSFLFRLGGNEAKHAVV